MAGILTTPMLDPLGAIIVELRTDNDVATLVAGRVRGGEALGQSSGYEGDALGPGHYKAFVVVRAQSVPPHPQLPITDAEILLQMYGTTYQNAMALYGACVKALHGVGVRVKSNGLGIYRSWIASGGEAVKDPDTGQPYVEAIVRLIATAQTVPT